MTYYSFIQEAECLEEGRLKSTMAGILALLGTAGVSTVKMPAAYIAKHPGETTFGKSVIMRMMKKPKSRNYVKDFTKGFNWAKEGFYKANPAAQKTEKLGKAILKTIEGKSSVSKNANDVFHGKVSF